MKIYLTNQEAIEVIKTHYQQAHGIEADITFSPDVTDEAKINKLNQYWRDSILPVNSSIINREGNKITVPLSMKIPLIKLYRAMYLLTVGKPCDLAKAKNFVENH